MITTGSNIFKRNQVREGKRKKKLSKSKLKKNKRVMLVLVQVIKLSLIIAKILIIHLYNR